MHDEAVFGGNGAQEMLSVTSGGRGLVAVGTDSGRGAAVVWTSTDGVVWRRAAHNDAVFGRDGSGSMEAVTTGGPGLVAVGHDGGQNSAVAWTSTDGRHWQRIEHERGPRCLPACPPQMLSVTSGGPGLVAVGFRTTSSDWSPAVWTSTDGLDWRPIEHEESGRMWSVTAGGPGLVAVGRVGQAAMIWTSP